MFKGIQKTTLIDFPGRLACTLFTGGCNFRCGYCYNSGLVLAPQDFPTLPTSELLSFLAYRKKYLEGVCITGGEPTLYGEQLTEFISKLKELGYEVKLDTNGTNPTILKKLIDLHLVDYIAMDIKADIENYDKVVCTHIDSASIRTSIRLIMQSNIEYEFRSTVVPDVFDEETMHGIAKEIKGAKVYYLQQFKPSDHTISQAYRQGARGNRSDLERFKSIIQQHVDSVQIRD